MEQNKTNKEDYENLCAVEAMQFLGITKTTLHKYINNNGLPVHKPKGGRPFYIKSELREWLKNQ